MPFVAADWSITRATKQIRYIGDAHGGASPSYATVIELHRALGDFADNETSGGDDELSIIDQTPSDRGGVDTNITLLNGYNIDQTASEHLYDGSITQANGDEIWDGIQVFGNATSIQIIQNGAVLVNDFWNEANMRTATEDAVSSTTHRFMVKVRDAGADIDGRRLIGTQRVFNTIPTEFQIGGGTNRGNNTLALRADANLNNQTGAATVATWTDIVNNNEGYIGIDADGNAVDEFYYSEWDLGSRSKNDFYERALWIQREGTAETLYGLAGDVFRGITHEIDIDTPTGTFQEPEPVSWPGGTGQLLAIDSTTAGTKMWIQLLTGLAPGDNVLITGGTSSATALVNVTVTQRLTTQPFIGATTGTAIIGAFGLGIEAADLTNSDLLTDLTNTTRQPPNNVTFTVNALSNGEDRVLVTNRGFSFFYDNEAGGPFQVDEIITFTSPAGTARVNAIYNTDVGVQVFIGPMLTGSQPTDNSGMTGGTSGATADVNGAVPSSIDLGQLQLNATLSGAAVTSIQMDAAIPTDTPSAGEIFVQLDNGNYLPVVYTSYTGDTFTVASTDFSTNNAAAGNNAFIAYINEVAGGATATFTSVFLAVRNLFIRIRDGGGSPKKPFETTAQLTAAGGSTTNIPTSDE